MMQEVPISSPESSVIHDDLTTKAEESEQMKAEETEQVPAKAEAQAGLEVAAETPGAEVSEIEGETAELPLLSPLEVALSYLTPEQHQQLLDQIARQLEYYFSHQNLSKDTYLRTLRDLNDGCVPLTILANFAKIKLIFATFFPAYDEASAAVSSMILLDDHLRRHFVSQAVLQATDRLFLYTVQTDTGKKIHKLSPPSSLLLQGLQQNQLDTVVTPDTLPDDEAKQLQELQTLLLQPNAGAILAIAPLNNEPLLLSPSAISAPRNLQHHHYQQSLHQQQNHIFNPSAPETAYSNTDNSNASASVLSSQQHSFSNTIILRDVDPNVTEDQVRTLFQDHIENCPAILDIHADIACSWFISFSTSSRQEMLRVLMQVRMLTLGGSDNYVQARLKAIPVAVLEPSAPAHAMLPGLAGTTFYDGYGEIVPTAASSSGNSVGARNSTGGRNNKKKRNNNRKNGSNNNKSSAGKNNNNNRDKDSKDHGQQSRHESQQPVRSNKSSNTTATTSNDNNKKVKKQGNTYSNSAKKAQLPPPSMGEKDFPTLQAQDRKVEWDCCNQEGLGSHDNEDNNEGNNSNGQTSNTNDDNVNQTNNNNQDHPSSGSATGDGNKSFSDAASTVTTTSTSSMSGAGGEATTNNHSSKTTIATTLQSHMPAKKCVSMPSLTGYAAALRKAATADAAAGGASKDNNSTADDSKNNSQKKSMTDQPSAAVVVGAIAAAATTTSTTPKWGRGRSFAEIVRAE